jgi:hypothetical protein
LKSQYFGSIAKAPKFQHQLAQRFEIHKANLINIVVVVADHLSMQNASTQKNTLGEMQ